MVCDICIKTAKQEESFDCFEKALESLKQHYIFYRNSLKQRDLELQDIKKRNDQLNKALEILQKNQQPSKKFKPNHELWIAPKPISTKINNSKDEPLTDISITDDDDDVAGADGASNLNMALNSEQLFETSVLSPARAETSLTSSELVFSPRKKITPQRNKQRENMRTLKDRNKLLQKSKSEFHAKDRSNLVAEKSWAINILKPPAAMKSSESKVGVDVKPEKMKSLSLKKVNPSKMKQSVLQFNSSKDSSVIESDICEDIIDASPVVCKNSRAGKSWAHRSGHNHSSHNSLSHRHSPSNTNNNTTNLTDADSSRKHETSTNIPIENIVFDFSPTKKQDMSASNSPCSTSNILSKKQLQFNARTGNDTTTDCMALPNDQTLSGASGDSSSVVILTPMTQDIIFLDDTNNDEFTNIDTMDLLADIQKHETDNMQNLKKYESKNLGKRQKLEDVKQLGKPSTAKEAKVDLVKPVATIKREKISQNFKDFKTEVNKVDNENISSTIKNLANDVAAKEEENDEDDSDDDAMPQPIIVKAEPDEQETHKKLSIKQRFNIDCDDCEKFFRYMGANLTDREIEEHIRKCLRHKRCDIMRQNTPEDFWNPFILSFAENDPRNEVLIDTRFKDNKHTKK